MSDTQWGICQWQNATEEEAKQGGPLGRWIGTIPIPPAFVDALRGATEEQMQEIADYTFVATRFPDFVVQEFTSSGSAGTRHHWRMSAGREHRVQRDTRAEALHALAESVKGEATT